MSILLLCHLPSSAVGIYKVKRCDIFETKRERCHLLLQQQLITLSSPYYVPNFSLDDGNTNKRALPFVCVPKLESRGRDLEKKIFSKGKAELFIKQDKILDLVTLSKSLNFSVPHFTHLQIGGKYGTRLSCFEHQMRESM